MRYYLNIFISIPNASGKKNLRQHLIRSGIEENLFYPEIGNKLAGFVESAFRGEGLSWLCSVVKDKTKIGHVQNSTYMLSNLELPF